MVAVIVVVVVVVVGGEVGGVRGGVRGEGGRGGEGRGGGEKAAAQHREDSAFKDPGSLLVCAQSRTEPAPQRFHSPGQTAMGSWRRACS